MLSLIFNFFFFLAVAEIKNYLETFYPIHYQLFNKKRVMLIRDLSELYRIIMTENFFNVRKRYVIGPDGSPLTISDLPPKNTKRWVIRRKAEVVAAVRGGLLSLEEACDRYTLTVDEFLSWQKSIDEYGLAGLRATRVQDYRR